LRNLFAPNFYPCHLKMQRSFHDILFALICIKILIPN
jgi:hypothetical protein